MKKNVAKLVTISVLAVSLSACGGGQKNDVAPEATKAVESNKEEVSEGLNAGEEKEQADVDYSSLEPVELIAADTTSVGTAAQMFGQTVADKVHEITSGQLTISYYPNSELGGDADLIRQEKSGDIDIHLSQTAPMVSFIPEMGVFDLPMVFSQYTGDEIEEVLNNQDSQFRQKIGEAYENQGYHLLGFLQNATYRLTTANKELRTLADFSGLQIRTMENTNHMAFWSAIGSDPTPISYPEVFISLQNGTIDAQENAADSCASLNLQDVQKYLCNTNHILYLNQMSMNKERYENLDPAYQAALDQAVAEAIAEIRPQLTVIDEENKKKLEDGGMELISYEDSFFEEVMNTSGVQELYQKIDEDVHGLGTVLQEELAKQK